MPLRLNVGVTRKVGLPEYSSVGASCHVEVELDASLIDDPDGFKHRVRDAYVACQQAVDDELTLLQGQSAAPVPTHHANGSGYANGNGTATVRNGASPRNGDRRRLAKPATANQVRAIVSIARRQRADLDGLLRDEFGVDRPEDLSLSQASTFIDRLKAASDVWVFAVVVFPDVTTMIPEADPVSARTKLNVAYANGALIVSSLFGLLAGNWAVFFVALAVTLCGGLYSGEIRPTPRRR